MQRLTVAVLLVVFSLSAGCTNRPREVALDHETDWFEGDAVVWVEGRVYRKLWQAAENSLRRFEYDVARSDYRGGLLTSEPRDGGQFFEPWRDDVRTVPASAESSLGLTRRRIRFDFEQVGRGYRVTPRVLVERLASGERRITDAADFRSSLGQGRLVRRSSEGNALLTWYPLRRDHALERSLADRIARRSGAARVDR